MNINGKTTFAELFPDYKPGPKSGDDLEVEIPTFLRPGYRGAGVTPPTRPVLEATPFEDLEIPALLRRGG